MRRGKEYGAFIYRFRVLWLTYYIMGETYQGYQTTNWYTVLNGLAIGYIVGRIRQRIVNTFWPVASLFMIGFAHTHPWHGPDKTSPSIWDKRMKLLLIFSSVRIFPIFWYDGRKVQHDYF